ncbi:hypothetical protein Ddc_22568 [Ditylenchus destructor]|nr:hypothetical protein Ddc_22568 [Ditylenchus destructor]
MALLPNEIYDDIAKFVKISSYKDLVLTSSRMRRIMEPFMRRQKIRVEAEAKLLRKPLIIGSVRSNRIHSEPKSGLPILVALIMDLERKTNMIEKCGSKTEERERGKCEIWLQHNGLQDIQNIPEKIMFVKTLLFENKHVPGK